MYGKTYRNCVKAEEALDREEEILDEESLHKWFERPNQRMGSSRREV